LSGILAVVKPFVGRQKELRKLEQLRKKQVASFVVIRGRRRIGKSRLIEEFAQEMPSYLFSGLPPAKGMNRQGQLEEFAAQISRKFDLPTIKSDNWGDLFWQLSKRCASGPILIALDEISWIGSKDPNFLGHLKNAWDLHFSKNPELILVVCGSVSSWIEKNILSATGFVGRISLDLHLKELPLQDASQFWDHRRVAPYEIFKTLSVTGGVPRYLEELDPGFTAEENIQRLCFDKSGLLYREFDQIFSDLFSSRALFYATIVESLATGPKSLEEVVSATGKQKSIIASYLHDLQQAGFISADPTWNLTTMKRSRLQRYRLSDNYIRFYLKYIAPNRDRIERDTFHPESLLMLPAYEAMMGLQFENLVLNNVPALCEALHIPYSSIVRFGPYFQRRTKRQEGCQVDLLLETQFRTLLLCEVKFSADKVTLRTAHEMEEKLKRMPLKKGWSRRTVLIHVNGATGELLSSGTFDHIIDFSKLLSVVF
jgi:uncharacterized protein